MAVDITSIVSRVEKPGRYIGGELNQIVKEQASVRVALCFPDVYEVAMSHTGLRILYHCLNEQPGYAAERCYAPWPDLEAELRRTGTPLWALESRRALSEFDVIGFSLQYELSYPNLLNMLELGGVSVFSKDRGAADPLVIAGGSGAFNPEPLADFVDGFLIGEGEDAIVEVAALLEQRNAALQAGAPWTRRELLERLTKIQGMYVPAFFEFEFAHGGPITALRRLLPGYEHSGHRQVADLDKAPFPRKPLVPNVAIVHDRVGIEVQRGCTKGCRFCQAGMIFRPTRQRNPKTVLKIVEESLDATGQDEVSFLSLSIGDYEPLQPLLRNFFNTYDADRVGVSLPSLRTETLTQDVVNEIARGKKHSFTLAPEAGSDRMRRIINKGNTEENLMRAVDTAVAAGWTKLKYYFMIGLPYELHDDRLAIAHLGIKSRERARKTNNTQLDVTVSVSSFCPKPHTPFQWEPQISEDEIRQHQNELRDLLRKGNCGFRYHNAGQTMMEGVISRGDRRVAKVIYEAYRLGCRLDAWDEHFKLPLWLQACEVLGAFGLDWSFYHRRRALDEILPWDAVDSGVDKKFLAKELARAQREAEVEDCAWGKCHACSACDFETFEPLVYPRSALPELAPKAATPRPTTSTHLRLSFAKDGLALHLSHLELMGAMLRAIRRAKLDVAHTQGFSPKPKIAFSPALPFGVASDCEAIDVELFGEVDAQAVLAVLQRTQPSGVHFSAVERIDANATSIGNAINTMTFEARFASAEQATAVLARWRSAETLVCERLREGKGKRFDLRRELASVAAADPLTVAITLHNRIDGSVRLDDIAGVLFGDAQPTWRKTAISFGEQQLSTAEKFSDGPAPRKGKHSKFHKQRGGDRDANAARPRSDDEFLANAPFAER